MFLQFFYYVFFHNSLNYWIDLWMKKRSVRLNIIMLLKKKFMLLNFTQKRLKAGLVYFFKKRSFNLLLSIVKCGLEQRKIANVNLKYSYNLNCRSLTSYVLEMKLKVLLNFFYYFNCLNLATFIKKFSKTNYLISLIRSPFVFKKSMEQLRYDHHKFRCRTNFLAYNFVVENYYSHFLKKELNETSISKYFLKINFK